MLVNHSDRYLYPQGVDARVPRVVQFGTPRTLLELQQHCGRAGRDGGPSYSLLLLEPSVLQVIVRKKPKPLPKGKGKGKGKAAAVTKTTANQKALTTATKSNAASADTDKAKQPAQETQTAGGGKGKTSNNANSKGKGKAKANAPVTEAVVKEEPVEVILSAQRQRKRVFADLEADDDAADQAQTQLHQAPQAADANEGCTPKDLEALVDGQPIEYRKEVEEEMREYCKTERCRRVVTMAYFNSPPSMQGKLVSLHVYYLASDVGIRRRTHCSLLR